jgi:UDP-glucose 4-epimerase
VLESTHTDYVYHAAALKVIPTCEENPTEAYKTNVLGSLNVMEACIKNAVQKGVLISTDKAVKPVNTYGMTKALAEKTWLAPRSLSSTTTFGAVRYGNVVGSRGSIIPFFKQLMSQGRPLPITDRSMSRFMLTLSQAVNLVFFATKTAIGGEIFIPKNPACKIIDLAEAMAGKGYPLVNVGIRAGEKIAEVLISEEEIRRTEVKEECFIIHPHGRFHDPSLANEFSSETARRLTVSEIASLVKRAGF